MKKTRSVSLKSKLITGLSGMLFLFLCVALFNLNQVNQIKNQLAVQNDKVELKLLSLELKEMVQELNIIASGLQLSKNPEFIPKYSEKRAVFEQMVKRIGDTATTDEQRIWRSKLILLTGEYTDTFDVAVRIINDKSLTIVDMDRNMEYLYNESQRLMNEIFTFVDHFYVSFTQEASAATMVTQEKLNSTVSIMLTAFILVAFSSVGIALLLIRSFMNPIQRLQHAVKQIAAGDLRHKINSSSFDELGKLSHSFDEMIDQVKGMLSNTQMIASSLSENSRSFHEFSGATATANKDIVRAIQEISAGSEKQARYSEDSAYIISETTKEIREITEYTVMMQRKSKEAAFNTHMGSQSMEGLKSAAEQSEKVLHQVYLAMESLSRSSAQIGKIVGSITEISTQTNVLALNAAIEAARAGVHGKGFSVIADEVRQLSTQTNESSKTITRIVQSLEAEMSEMEASLGVMKLSFEKQTGKMNESMDAFMDIRLSMNDLSGHIEQIHTLISAAEDKNSMLVSSVQHIASIAQETAAGVEEVNSSSQQQDSAIHRIASQSDDILSFAQRLFNEINRFKISDVAEIHDNSVEKKQHSTEEMITSEEEPEKQGQRENGVPEEHLQQKEGKEKEVCQPTVV